MAWRSSSSTPPPPASTLSKVVPLALVFIVLSVLGVIGFYVYSAINDIATGANKHLEKKKILCSKDGVKVSVKKVEDEQYVDRTQSVLVNAWNLSAVQGRKKG